MSKLASGIFLTLFLFSILAPASQVQIAKASSSVIYINPDGSVTPSTANITTSDNVTYSFTGNNYLPIIVNRSNVIINGGNNILQASGADGFYLRSVENVTISNTTITKSNYGIYLYSSSLIALTNNTIRANSYGGIVADWYSYSNKILENKIVGNGYDGIYLADFSDRNKVSSNEITSNSGDGIYLWSSSSNVVTSNNVTANGWNGIELYSSTNNTVYHNNITNNAVSQAYVEPLGGISTNIWDNGYRSGGNYWSNYNGTDANHDGIGDTPYVIDTNNTDQYPLMHPWKVGDTNYDGKINVLDLITVAIALGTKPPNPNYNIRADVNNDEVINVLDLIMVARHLDT